MGKVVNIVGNIIGNSWIDNWCLWLPSDDFQVPHLENFEELIPEFLCPIRDIKADGNNVAKVAGVEAHVYYHSIFSGILVDNVRLE